MKRLCLQLAATLLFLALSTVSRAAIVSGTVFCDANSNGVISAGDPGIPAVLVIITNQDNSFSNSAVTAADGSFNIEIPDPSPTPTAIGAPSQVFVETLDPESLPDGSSIEIPTPIGNPTNTPAYIITFATTPTQTNLVFLSGSGSSSTGDWLINNPNCGSVGNCRLSGGGHINPGGIDHTFSGRILSGNPPRGNWTDNSRALGKQFRSTSIQTVICGVGSIEFTGTGTLGTKGGKVTQPVQFTAEIQNLSVVNGSRTRTVQAYFLNVSTPDGTTVLELVSADPADPADIAPVLVKQSSLRLRAEQ